MSVSFFTFYSRERTITHWFTLLIFRHYIRFPSLSYTVRIAPIYLLFSYQFSFVSSYDNDSCVKSVKFRSLRCTSQYFTLYSFLLLFYLPWSCSCINQAAFGLFRHNIGQYGFSLPFTKKQVAFPD